MTKRYRRLAVKISLVIIVILSVKILYYIYKPEPMLQNIEVRNAKPNEKVIEPDYSKIEFKCSELKRLDGTSLEFCTGKFYDVVLPNISYVMGQYFNASSTIYINTPYTDDRAMHELYHAVDVYQPNRDNETQAYEFQSLYVQLKDKKLI